MPLKLVYRTAALLLATTCVVSSAYAQTAHATPEALGTAMPASVDPLTATIHIEDVERFAKVLAATNGRPTVSDIQKGYLDHASYGVSIFTPGRIGDAARLASKVNADPASYDRAVRECLPRVKAATADLRAIYLALHGLLPDEPLPQIYVVIGAGNSGGTAGPGAQVIGLEVLCAENPSATGSRKALRRFFAHETVHTFQQDISGIEKSPLLGEALVEGAADFIATLVTGEEPEPDRAAWALPRETMLWDQFQKDMPVSLATLQDNPPPDAVKAVNRWLHNYQSAPAGWPSEAGYWVGMRIWAAYYTAATDKHRAIRDMLRWDDPEAILRKSGYQR
ncbi:DUF2268 domain-containing putative Zn-dependent protease [Sphingobium sp. SYK-6]|uniref:DUF2268 domain-containing putative Zn-dependent protease n=1 Tax=Sphingobium sp. (strain NBRC 103272 / SYK-6) TaxID=627192 RepID=UPI0011D18C5A|nr:DUF2268 domain-containing putative Zn-dependent protease [Sphingobium sp. SYK-6]